MQGNGRTQGQDEDDHDLEPVTVVTYDWGDLPDGAAGVGPGDYQTLASNGGPSHLIIPGLRIGAQEDDELNGQPNASATGDDVNGVTPDDEDGVTLPVVVAGNQPRYP